MAHGTIEIEAKIAVADFDPVRAQLQVTGAKYVGRVLETNRFYDRPDGSLQKTGCGLRVRDTKVLEGPPGAASITFKGPLQPGPLKTRPEYELSIGDAQAAAALLARLGFVETIAFEKRRESWRLADCLIELDELPYVGRFVEIEGPSEAAIRSIQAALGLADAPLERSSYLALLARHAAVHGAASRFHRL